MPGEFAPVLVNVIGTCNEDTTAHLSEHSRISFNPGPPTGIVFSPFSKPTQNNILRAGEFSVNFGTTAMCGFIDAICACDEDIHNNKLGYDYVWGEKTKTPIPDVSPFVVEAKVSQTHRLGDYYIFFAEIVCQHLAKSLAGPRFPQHESKENRAWQTDDPHYKWLLNMSISELDPILWLGHRYKIGDII